MISDCSVSRCTSSREWAVIRRWLWVITVPCLPLLLPLVIHLNRVRATQATRCLISINSLSFSILSPFVTEVMCRHCSLLCRGGISPQPFPDHFLCLHIHIYWDKPSLLPRQIGLQLLFSELVTQPGLNMSLSLPWLIIVPITSIISPPDCSECTYVSFAIGSLYFELP